MNMDTQRELEWSTPEFKSVIEVVMDQIMTYLDGMDAHPVNLSDTTDPERLREMIEPIPEVGTSIESLMHLIFEEGAVQSLNPTSPGFMGYVPGGGLLHAGLADLIANVLNRYVGVVAVAPVFAQMESNVIRWLSQIVGYPEEGRGTLTSGGSLATFSAIVTARHVRLGDHFSKGMIYVSDQVHHCVTKAARMAGFPRANIHVIKSDDKFRINLDEVVAAISGDRDSGRVPFMLVGSAGTTNTGAVDPLTALHKLAVREELWFHVDAAYGGFFSMTDRGREKLKGIEQADSIVLDPHKTLFLPYGTGALLIRDGHLLREAHCSTGEYMPPMQQDDVVFDFCELSPELTRPFRGLRIWLPIKMHGASVFRAYLDEKMDLAKWLYAKIEGMPELVVIAPPELSILAFAVRDVGQTVSERNKQTRALMQQVNNKNRVYLTGTRVHGLYVIRVAISGFRTHREHVEILLEDLQQAM